MTLKFRELPLLVLECFSILRPDMKTYNGVENVRVTLEFQKFKGNFLLCYGAVKIRSNSISRYASNIKKYLKRHVFCLNVNSRILTFLS